MKVVALLLLFLVQMIIRETYPFIGSSEIITDISSTGKTLEDNNLRVLKDGLILKSSACLLLSKNKAKKLKSFLTTLEKK